MKTTDVKERILEVAARLFYQQGYNCTGINQIIEEAGIARASLYHHFPSKADLLMVYLHQTEQAWFDELDAQLATHTEPEQKLWTLFDYRQGRQLRSNFGGCAFIKITNEVGPEETEIFAISAHQKDRVKRLYPGSVKPDTKGNTSSVFSLDELVEAFFLLLEGATSTATIYKELSPLENAKKIAQKLL